jgi:hypothetical protein
MGFLRGKTWAEAAGRDGADLWRIFWARLADIGPGVLIRKVKDHAGINDVISGRITPQMLRGNAAADRYAVIARKLAVELSPCREAYEALARAKTYYKWMERIVEIWSDRREAADIAGQEGAEG